MNNKITAEEWEIDSLQGNRCGVLGCDNGPHWKCPGCEHHYCNIHKGMHIMACRSHLIDCRFNDNTRTDGEALEMRKQRHKDKGDISDILQERRDTLRQNIWDEIQRIYPSIDDYDEMYVTGSWAKGEAIYGVSDLDIVVVVDPIDAEGKISGTQDHFKNNFSKDRFENDSWLFVDLWLDTEPPKNSVIL